MFFDEYHLTPPRDRSSRSKFPSERPSIMGNALFIVWRESTEAMLVVGILYAWLSKHPDATRGMRYLWSGVGAGIALALVLAAVMLGSHACCRTRGSSISSGDDARRVGPHRADGLLDAPSRTHVEARARTEHAEERAAANWWGLLIVVALAVGRESAETVVFLYGLGAQNEGAWKFLGVLALGIAAAFATFWALQQGGKVLSWRTFFRVSEILLLLLAGALLVSAVDKLIALDMLPSLIDPTWDTSAVLDDSGRVGGLVASFTGYRARPALLPLLMLAAYWAPSWCCFAARRVESDTAVIDVAAAPANRVSTVHARRHASPRSASGCADIRARSARCSGRSSSSMRCWWPCRRSCPFRRKTRIGTTAWSSSRSGSSGASGGRS